MGSMSKAKMNSMATVTTGNKPPFPTTTTHAIRLCLFQATRRPVQEKGVEVLTPWGKIRRWGRLGQQHADVLEAICYCRERRGDLEDGRIKLLVDPARVRRRSGQTSGQRFSEVLKELEQAVIEIIEPQRLACSGHLIDHISKAVRSDGTPLTRHDPLTRGERPLWRVELGKAFCTLIAGDVWIGYDPTPIAALRHGISQALARHVLTHKRAPAGGWTLDGLIRAVSGEELSEQQLRDRRREVRGDSDALAGLGIEIEAGRVRRVEQRPGAWSKGPMLADTDSDT